MLHAFDNETENGKLYISYPMIESLREMNTKIEDYKSLYVPIDELIHYKQYVSEESNFRISVVLHESNGRRPAVDQ